MTDEHLNTPTDAAPAAAQGSPAASGTPKDAASKPATSNPATVLVRGETVNDAKPHEGEAKAPAKPLSPAKVRMQGHLPALDDDADVGVEKPQVVVRDGKADLAFTGTLLASAAPEAAPNGQWDELRVYETSAAKFVFSKVTRHVQQEDQDEHEAEIFEPEPSSKPSQLLRSARDLTRNHPLTWKDAAVDFFGYEPLAKSLYRKLGDGFEEHVS